MGQRRLLGMKRKRRCNLTSKKGIVENENKGGNLNLLFWNVAGLNGKDSEFFKFLAEFDFIGLVETWVEQKDWEKIEKKLPEGRVWTFQGATKIHKKGRAKGGIITGVKKELSEKGITAELNGAVRRTLVIDNVEWNIWTIYNREGSEKWLEKLDEFEDEEEKGPRIWGGDFNARTGCEGPGDEALTHGVRRSKDKTVNGEGRGLIKWAEERGLNFLNGGMEGDEEGRWTYVKGERKSVIDYVVENLPARIKTDRFEVLGRFDSDHMPLVVQIEKEGTQKTANEQKTKRKIQPWGGGGGK